MQNLQVEGEQGALRYNADVARRVLTRATEIEQAKQETLTAVQIEALGRELGLSPDAVRRALGEIQPAPIVTVTAKTQSHLPLLRQRDIRGILASGAIIGIANAFFLFLLLRTVSMVGSMYPSPAMAVLIPLLFLFMVYALAPLLAYRHGWRTGDLRAGIIAGAWGGICSAVCVFVACLFAASYSGSGAIVATLLYPIFAATYTLVVQIFAAIGMGALGGVARRWWDGLRKAEER